MELSHRMSVDSRHAALSSSVSAASYGPTEALIARGVLDAVVYKGPMSWVTTTPSVFLLLDRPSCDDMYGKKHSTLAANGPR